MKQFAKIILFVGLLITSVMSSNDALSSSFERLRKEKQQVQHQQDILNTSAVDTLEFIKCDHVRPYFKDFSPYRDKIDVERFVPIRFTVNDDPIDLEHDMSGVDTSKVFISIRSRTVNVERVKPNFKYSDENFYSVRYEFIPPDSFAYSDTIHVKLEATDLSRFENFGTIEYKFYILGDTVAPVLNYVYPLPESVGVPVDSGIVINGTDVGSGVDFNDIEFRINGSASTVVPIGDPHNFFLRFDPEQNWQYEDSIHVFCLVRDLSGNKDSLDYWFRTELAPPPPRFFDISPAPGAEEVALDAIISFKVIAYCVEVDESSISINGEPPTRIDPLPGGGYYCEYDPENPFNWNETVTVNLSAADLCSPPQQSDSTYYFTMVRDSVNPYFQNLVPQPYDMAAPTDSIIFFTIADDLSGVDPNSVTISVSSRNETIENSIPVIVSDFSPDSIRFKFQSGQDYDYNDTVEVRLIAGDMAGNEDTLHYEFYTSEFSPGDVEPPWFEELIPDSNTIDVDRDSGISFMVVDDLSGIKTSEIKISITTNSWEVTDVAPDSIHQLGEKNVRCFYQPETEFGWGDTISVTLKAADLENNNATLSYSFYTAPDTIPPELTPVYPVGEQTGVPVDSSIFIRGTEIGVGVDEANIALLINGIEVEPEIIIHDLMNFEIHFARETGWEYGEIIEVQCIVSDLANNDTTLNYSFEVEKDLTGPFFTNFNPEVDETHIEFDSSIYFTVYDDKSDVDENSVRISVQSRNLQVFDQIPELIERYKPDSLRFKFDPDFTFDWTDTVVVTVEANDLASPPNWDDSTYTFFTIRDSIPPVLTAFYPVDGAVDVPVDAGIIIHGTDIGRGCDITDLSNFTLNIYDEPVEIDSVIGTPHDFKIYFTPVTNWNYGEVYKVCPRAGDRDGNWSEEFFCICFTTERGLDEKPPWFLDISPEDGQTGVLLSDSIKFIVMDDAAGVNRESITVDIGDGQKVPQVIEPYSTKGFNCIYYPENDFDWNEAIEVNLHACDRSDGIRCADSNYTFYTLVDTTSPLVSLITPTEESNVPVDTDIVFELKDDVSLVDTSRFEFRVNDNLIDRDLLVFSSIDSGYRVLYDPSLPFEYDTEINLDVSVSDLAGNPTIADFTFQTEVDTFPPVIFNHNPEVFGHLDELGTAVLFNITDGNKAGVDESSIKLEISSDGLNFNELEIQIDNIGVDTFLVSSDYQEFRCMDTIWVKIFAEDNFGNFTGTDTTAQYYFTVLKDTDGPVAVLIEPASRIDVPLNQVARIEVVDSLCGVDPERFVFNALGDSGYSSNEYVIEKITDFKYNVIHTPEEEYHYNEIISLSLSGMDYGENQFMFSDSFTVISAPDGTPPFVFDHYPGTFSNIEEFQNNIRFKLADENSGINKESIQVLYSINDSIGSYENLGIIRKTGDDTVQVICEQLSYNYNDTVWVKIFAEDGFGNQTDTDNVGEAFYYFELPKDSDGPSVTLMKPIRKFSIDPDQVIDFSITDKKTGINSSSLNLSISGSMDYQGSAFEIIYESNDSLYVRHQPQTNYSYDEELEIKLLISDNIGNTSKFKDSLNVKPASLKNDIVVFDHVPEPFEHLSTFETAIKFKVKDTQQKLVKESITATLTIGTVETSLDIEPTNHKTYMSVETEILHFQYNDTVMVDIYAADRDGNHTDETDSDSTVHYYFTLPVDNENPIAELIRPEEDENVSPINQLEFFVTDSISGVKPESITLEVSGSSGYFSTQVETSPVDLKSCRVFHTPDPNFNYNEIINFTLTASDYANNTVIFSGSFQTTGEDGIPPKIVNHSPPVFSLSSSLINSISFDVTDDLSGVNGESIKIFYSINDSVNNFEPLQIAINDGTVDSVHIMAEQIPSVFYNDTIWVKIEAEDNTGNRTGTDASTFYYLLAPVDTLPPLVSAVNPTKLDEEDQSFVIEITDDLSGVDAYNAQILVTDSKGQNVHVLHDIREFQESRLVKFEISPQETWQYNDTLSLELIFSDKCLNETTEFFPRKILTPTLLPDLSVESLTTSADGKRIRINSTVLVQAIIKNQNIACDTPFEVKFEFEDRPDTTISRYRDGLGVNEEVTLEVEFKMKTDGRHKLTVTVDPSDQTQDSDKTNNKASKFIFSDGARIVVRSNPFTPNGDGFNDETKFDFGEFQISKPNLKIFTINGRQVVHIRGEEGKSFVKWNGLDQGGKLLLPGTYLYVLLDGKEAKARGCVAIAR